MVTGEKNRQVGIDQRYAYVVWMSIVGQCFAHYDSYRRCAEDYQAIAAGAFFVPTQEEPFPIYSKVNVLFHLPDGMRFDIPGEVIQVVPGRGFTIGVNPKNPSVDALGHAVRRRVFQERLLEETAPGRAPKIGLFEEMPTETIQIPEELRQQIRADEPPRKGSLLGPDGT